jgi:DNA-binding NtrC family response regulator
MASTASESVYEQQGADVPVPGALLVFSVNAAQLRTAAVPKSATVVFGRDDVGGSALPDARVSQPHCELSFDGRHFTVNDLSSRNGTWVDGVKVEPGSPRKASSGSVVRIAQSIFLLCDDVRRFRAASVTLTDGKVIGPAYRAVLDQVALGARSGGPVLVLGENGSGKEFLAQTFHEAANKSGPFIPVNCAEITKTISQSLLFGSVKGVATDVKETKGYIREANGGTLFLDELGELDQGIQAQLLRVVEQNEVMPVGATTYVPVKVRLISATNRNLGEMVEKKEFRQDLYYRLAQFQVRLPPLRDRREEIPWLITHTLGEKLAHPSLVERAMLRPWPGNIRELIAQTKNASAQATAEQSAVVRDKHLDAAAGMPTATGSHPAFVPARPIDETSPARPSAIAPKFGREELLAALTANQWNIAATQRTLGIPNRTTLVRMLDKYELSRPAGQPPDEPDAPDKE